MRAGDLCTTRESSPKSALGRCGEGGAMCSHRVPTFTCHRPPPRISCHMVMAHGTGKSLGRGGITLFSDSCGAGVPGGTAVWRRAVQLPLVSWTQSSHRSVQLPGRLAPQARKDLGPSYKPQGPGMAIVVSSRLTHLGRRMLEKESCVGISF